jgi:hypothetical protein
MDIKGFENDIVLKRFLNMYLDNNVMQHIFGSKIFSYFFCNLQMKYS